MTSISPSRTVKEKCRKVLIGSSLDLIWIHNFALAKNFAYVTHSREKHFDIRVSGERLIKNNLYSSTKIFPCPQSRDVIDQNKLWSSFLYISNQSIQGQKYKNYL